MALPTIDQAFIDKFNDDVHEAYQQGSSKLRMTVRTDAEVLATKVRFQKIGAISANTKTRHGLIPPSNPDHSYVDCNMEDKYTLDYADQLDLTKLNIDVRRAYMSAHVKAFARETDDIIIAAMTAGATQTVGSYGGLITRNNILDAMEDLDRNDVDRDGRWFLAVTPRQWASLMTISEFVNADYVGPQLPYIIPGTVRTWNGLHILMHNRLPGVGTSQAKLYLWHQASVGHGINSEVDVTWDWENERKAWSMAGSMSMGSVVIDANGLIEIRVNDTSALP